MKVIVVGLIALVLVGTSLRGDDSENQPAVRPHLSELALPFEPWEFKKTDGHLWLHFSPAAKKKTTDEKLMPRLPITVSLANVDTKFIPLVYFKGSEEERKKQKGINNAIAKFIAEQLKGKTVWIEDAQTAVFAGPRQVMGIVWFDSERKQSLQQLLVKKGLAVKQKARQRTDATKTPSPKGLPDGLLKKMPSSRIQGGLGFRSIDFNPAFWNTRKEKHKLKGKVGDAIDYGDVQKIVILRCNLHVPIGNYLENQIQKRLDGKRQFHTGDFPKAVVGHTNYPSLTALLELKNGNSGLLNVYPSFTTLELDRGCGLIVDAEKK